MTGESAVPKLARGYMLRALESLARQRCRRANCGTVCLCDPCAARYALPHYHPDPPPDIRPPRA
jgi:hypothetical protein